LKHWSVTEFLPSRPNLNQFQQHLCIWLLAKVTLNVTTLTSNTVTVSTLTLR
jgi:hypothetical protein